MSAPLRVLSYNILAPSLAMSSYFPEVPHNALSWKNRWKVMQEEFRTLRPDIVCLQEVERYEPSIRPFLETIGLSSVYVQKPFKNHGCLIAWNNTRLECTRHSAVYLDDAAVGLSLLTPTGFEVKSIVDADSAVCGWCTPVKYTASPSGPVPVIPGHLNDYVARGVAVLAELRSVDSGELFNVATTHLYWDPTKPNVKLAQIALMKLHMSSFGAPGAPWLLCGDMNSLPGSEACIALQSSASLPRLPWIVDSAREHPSYIRHTAALMSRSMPDVRTWKLSSPACTCGSDTGASEPEPTHTPFGEFQSAYASVAGAAGGPSCEPPFTTHTHKFHGTIDYILFEHGRWIVEDVLPLPGYKDIDTKKGLPDATHPSDHLPLLATLSLVPRTEITK